MAGNNNNVNIDAVDMPSYQNSGFGKSTGANVLQQETVNYPVDDATVNAQAKAQYKATFDIQQRGLSNQLSALIKAQADDADLLNKQYQQSVNTMMSKLAKRGLAIGATPQATTAALNRFRNDVMTERQATYNVQQSGVQAAIKASNDDFDLGVQARANQIRNNSLKSLNSLMTQMAQLQSSSFEDYVNYLLSKKKNNMQSQSAEIARKNLELDSKSTDIARKNILLDRQSIDLAKERLGIDLKSTDLDRKNIDIDSQSADYDKKKLEIAADDIALDKKFLKLRYKKSGGSSGGSGGRRRGGSSSSSSSASAESIPTSNLGSEYFSGVNRDAGLFSGNTKPTAKATESLF